LSPDFIEMQGNYYRWWRCGLYRR